MAGWSPESLGELLWWVAAALAIRCVFEPVMVAYYLWPALAAALVTASTSWSRLVPTSLAVMTLTFSSGAGWQGPWIWWVSMTAGLSLTLFLAHIRQHNAALRGADAARCLAPGAAARHRAVRTAPTSASSNPNRASSALPAPTRKPVRDLSPFSRGRSTGSSNRTLEVGSDTSTGRTPDSHLDRRRVLARAG